MTACVFTAALCGIAVIIFGNQIITLLFAEAEPLVKSNAMTYLLFSGVSYPFLALFSMAAGILRASGNTKSPLRASILSNIVNVGIGSLFIYVFDLGVTGAGVALLGSRITSAVILALILSRPETEVGIRKVTFKIEKEIIRPVIQIGLPACIDGFIFNGGKLLIQTFVAALGTVSLAANSVASSVTGLINIPGNAISIVAVTIVGQAVGAGIFNKELRKIIKSLIVYASVLLAVMTVVMMPILPAFLDLYAPPQEVKSMALSILHLILIMMPLTWPVAFILPSAVRSTGDSLYITVVSIISMWLVRVLGAWFVVEYTNWGVMGIWIFWCMDWVVRGVAFVLRTLKSKYINRVSDETPQQEQTA
jgi:putative MATE family efflux protein